MAVAFPRAVLLRTYTVSTQFTRGCLVLLLLPSLTAIAVVPVRYLDHRIDSETGHVSLPPLHMTLRLVLACLVGCDSCSAFCLQK